MLCRYLLGVKEKKLHKFIIDFIVGGNQQGGYESNIDYNFSTNESF